MLNTLIIMKMQIKTKMRYHQQGKLALNRKDILTCVITWMHLEDIMLSNRSLSEKDKYCMIPIL